jgi:hypothetical protein
MNDPIYAAHELGVFLSEHGIDHVVIGGLAVQIWGEERFTKDADLTISSSIEEGVSPVVRLITGAYKSRVTDPVEFARKSRIILIETSGGMEVDISLALPGYEEDLFERAISIEFQPGEKIFVCSPEDLIIHKAIAGRPQDLHDIEGVIVRQGERLDLGYLRRWLTWFSEMLEDDQVSKRFEEALVKVGPKNPLG